MMIEVNLLPIELRRVERTPLPRFLVIIFGTAAVLTLAALGMIVSLRTVPDLRSRENDLVTTIPARQVQAAAYDRILEEIAATQDRKKAISEVWRKRIMWSEKLVQIAEMTPAFVGLTDLALDEPRETGRGGEENGGTLTLQSICAGTDHSRIANVRRIFQGQYQVTGNRDPWVGKRFYGSFMDLLPTGTQMVEVKDCVETEALKFSLEMPLKPAAARLAEAEAAAQAETRLNAAEERGIPAATKDAGKPSGKVGTAGGPVQTATDAGNATSKAPASR